MASRRSRGHGEPGAARTLLFTEAGSDQNTDDHIVLQWIVSGFEDQALAQHRRIVRDGGRFFAVYRAAVA